MCRTGGARGLSFRGRFRGRRDVSRRDPHGRRRASSRSDPEPSVSWGRRALGDRAAVRDRLRCQVRDRGRGPRALRRGRPGDIDAREIRPRRSDGSFSGTWRCPSTRISASRPRSRCSPGRSDAWRGGRFSSSSSAGLRPSRTFRAFSTASSRIPDVLRIRPAFVRKAVAGAIALGRRKTSQALYASIGRLSHPQAHREPGLGSRDNPASRGPRGRRAGRHDVLTPARGGCRARARRERGGPVPRIPALPSVLPDDDEGRPRTQPRGGRTFRPRGPVRPYRIVSDCTPCSSKRTPSPSGKSSPGSRIPGRTPCTCSSRRIPFPRNS